MADLIAPRRSEALVGPKGMPSLRFIQYLEDIATLLNGNKVAKIDIGDWNMNTTPQLTVAHGLNLEDIEGVEIAIFNDAETTKSSLLAEGVATPQQTVIDGNWTIDATDIILNRVTGGNFDSANYQATSFNRGKIKISYT